MLQQGKGLKYVQFPARYHALVASTPGSVLLETSRFDDNNYRSYLFVHPVRMLSDGSSLFDEIEEALAGGAYVAGFLSYEYGEDLQGMGGLAGEDESASGMVWGLSQGFVFDHRSGEFEGEAPDEWLVENVPGAEGFAIRDVQFGIGEKVTAKRLQAIQEYIRAGETYQVNFTDRLGFDFSGSPHAMFSALVENQQVQYGALLHGESWHILSFSPELFFRRKEQRIVARPMKGTARRGVDLAEDEAAAHWLHNDAKNRSENVMIVDLLRNDLGRICEFGSVQVEELFAVEKYATLWQMASEISGRLRAGLGYLDIFRSLFPCGSITGAPKLRTMKVIQELEGAPRGVYTGAIGFFSRRGRRCLTWRFAP